MVLNGCLAGLVGITAGADTVSVPSAVLIGGIAGVLVVLAVMLFDKITDRRSGGRHFGAPGVRHLGHAGGGPVQHESRATRWACRRSACWPTACSASRCAWRSSPSLKYTMGLRVSRAEEIGGLDVGEHGMEAYPDFQGFLTK